MTFTADDYAEIRSGAQRSADALIPFVLSMLRSKGYTPETAADVGCGEGWWTVALARAGVQTTALDGPGGGGALELAPPGMARFVARDLRRTVNEDPTDPARLAERAGFAVCLEVAEHLPADRADALVSWLCDWAPVLIFSAAIPGQGGQGHVNEQWPDYWSERFNRAGMFVTGRVRMAIWDDDEIEHWYRQNLLLVWRPGLLRGLHPERPKRLVHPKLWAFHRGVWETL
jgi:hypothetical protein